MKRHKKNSGKSKSPAKGNRLTYPLPHENQNGSRLSTVPESSEPTQEESLLSKLSNKLSYKSNINRMFYNQADLDNNLTQYLLQGHQQLIGLINTLYKNKQYQDEQKQKQKQKKEKQKQKEKEKEKQKQNEIQIIFQKKKKNIIHTPQTATMVNKFKRLLEFDRDIKKIPQIKQSTIMNIFQYHKSKQQLEQLKSLVQKNGLYKTSLDNAIFDEIAKTIAPKFKQTIYLPTTLRVALTGVNWMDKEDQTASIALKIQARVHIPGFFHYPKTYTKLLKDKFKMSLKTQSHSYLRNLKVDFKQKKQTQRQIIKGNDIFNDNVDKKFHPNPYQYFTEVYKWKNYYSQRELYFKKIRQYEGCIIQVRVNDVKVKLNSITESAPFELIDFTGIIQLQSIQTKMKDWTEILFAQEQSYFRTFLEEMSPSVTLKFNIVSLYRDDKNIKLTKEIILNQIHSMDTVVKNQYYLAQKLLFLEASNKRESNYELRRSLLSYYWKKLPSSSLEQLSQQIEYKKKKKFYLKPKEDKNSKQFLEFKKFAQQFQQKEFSYYMVTELQTRISKILEQEAPKTEQQIQKCLQICQKLQNRLFKYQKNLQIMLQGEFDNKNRVKLEHFFGVTQKIRIKIKILQQYFIRQLHAKKINLRKRLKDLETKKITEEFQISGKLPPNQDFNVKEIIDLNEDQIKQLQTYLDDKLLSEDEKIVEKETKYDHDYNQSKAIFHFPFYRDPKAILLEIIISSVVLSLINLTIFFQDMHQLSNIIASVSSLMISFIGMITIVQKQINSNSLSMIQVIFYLLFLTPIITLYYSYRTVTFQNIQPNIEPTYYNKFMYLISNYLFCSINQTPTNGYENSIFFWYCFIVTFLGLAIPILLTIRFRFLKNNSSRNIRTIKQSEAISTLFPGSPDVDNIVFQKGSFQWSTEQSRQSTFHGAVISMITSYLLQLQNKRQDKQIKAILENQQIGTRIDNKKYDNQVQQYKYKIDVERKRQIKIIIEKLQQQERKKKQKSQLSQMSYLAANLKFVLSFSKKIVSNMFEQQKSNKKKEVDKLTESVLMKLGSLQSLS